MKFLKKSVIRIIIPLISVLWLVGCETVSKQSSREAYAWVKQIEEKVDPVPFSEPALLAPLATPTSDIYVNEQLPWGAPRDLAQRIEGKSSKESKPSISNNTGKSKDFDNRGYSNPVVVNVNSSAAETDISKSDDLNVVEESRLEVLFGGENDRKANRNLEQFGYSFFEGEQAAAIVGGPIPDDYVLGPGDEIIISLSGGVDAYHRLVIDRDGLLSVPEFGQIPLASRKYGELRETLNSFLLETRRGFDLSVSLGKLRSIRVNVIGRVLNPGVVDVSALGSHLTALLAAGGPEKGGSLRHINLRRTVDGVVETEEIDLYDFLCGPDSTPSHWTLRDGDTIHVPSIGPTIGIAGYVQRPGIFELKGEAITIGEAIEIAGGLTAFSFIPLASLESTVDGRGRQRFDVKLDEVGMEREMRSGELLMIEAVDDSRQPLVHIVGEVARPGDYQYQEGMKISDLIERADGLTVNAYLPQVLISRQLGRSEVIDLVPDRKSQNRTRRVFVADLSKAMANDPKHDLQLLPLDFITVRSIAKAQEQAVVEIIGSVQSPGLYELTGGMRVSDLVAIANNLKQEVYYDQAELIRRIFDEKTRRLDVKRFRFDLRAALEEGNENSNLSNPLLVNGDRLVIRSLQEAQVRVWVEGRVTFPGEYIFPAGAKISDLIAAAGGVLDDADMRAAVFTRESTKFLQKDSMEHLTERTRRLNEKSFERMVQTGQPREGLAAKISLDQTRDTMGRMSKFEVDGRVVIPFDVKDFPQSDYNLVLESGDRLVLPRFHRTVSVVGHVFRPISLVTGEGVSVKDALMQAGGLTELAAKNLIYIVRADGSVENIGSKGRFGNHKMELLAGDVLLVPRSPMERTLGAEMSDAIQMIRQAAEAALVASQIGSSLDMTLVSPASQSRSSLDGNVLLD